MRRQLECWFCLFINMHRDHSIFGAFWVHQISISGLTKSTHPRMVDLFVCCFHRTHSQTQTSSCQSERSANGRLDSFQCWTICGPSKSIPHRLIDVQLLSEKLRFFLLLFFSRIQIIFRVNCSMATFVTHFHLYTLYPDPRNMHSFYKIDLYKNSYSSSIHQFIWVKAIVSVAECECAACACRFVEGHARVATRVSSTFNGGRWLRSATVSRCQPDGNKSIGNAPWLWQNNTVSIDTRRKEKRVNKYCMNALSLVVLLQVLKFAAQSTI